MENLDSISQWLHDEGVFLFDRQLPFSKMDSHALTIKLTGSDTWGIFLDGGELNTTAKEKSALLHESGHYATGTTHEVYSPLDLVAKHEHKADKWAIQRAISADELRSAMLDGCTTIYELANYFDLTEDFMRKVVCWYTHGNLSADLYF